MKGRLGKGQPAGSKLGMYCPLSEADKQSARPGPGRTTRYKQPAMTAPETTHTQPGPGSAPAEFH